MGKLFFGCFFFFYRSILRTKQKQLTAYPIRNDDYGNISSVLPKEEKALILCMSLIVHCGESVTPLFGQRFKRR